MRAVQFNEYGGPEVLHVADVAEPHAGHGQVRLSVRAAGVNLSDLMKIRAGTWKGKPIALPSASGSRGRVSWMKSGKVSPTCPSETHSSAVVSR